jgi:putative ABC transport system substrate-binding protein
MKRRAFVATLGSAAVWPLLALAEQPALPVIGFLHSEFDTLPVRQRGFRQGLKDTGFVEGENLAVVYRWAKNQIDRLPELVAELVHQQVAVLVTVGNATTLVAKETTTIPIVFNVNEDPVRLGLVASLARPGGKLTGVNFLAGELAAKRLELLREPMPGAIRVAVLVNPANATTAESTLRDVAPAARAMGLQILVFKTSTGREIDAAFDAFVRERPDALFVDPDPFFASQRDQLVRLASHHAVPAIYGLREFAEAGGLMSYGSSIADVYRHIGVYVGRVLNGEKPANLPILQPTKFELVINLKTAKALGLDVPPTLLAHADEVIE